MALTIAISTLLDQSRRSWHAISRQQTDRDTGLTPLWSLPRSKVFTVLREADLPPLQSGILHIPRRSGLCRNS